MKALEPLVGRWVTTITMISPPERAGERYRAIDTYRWMTPDRKVLIHEVEARMGDAAIISMEIYSEVDGQITSRNFAAGGEISDYLATMKEGVWSVTGARERFESTTVDGMVIEGLWRRWTGEHWADWMTVRLDRVI
jgi:hypothetical protein